MMFPANRAKAARFLIAFELSFKVLVAFLPYPHHFPKDAFLIDGTKQLCALVTFVLFNALFQIALNKTDVVLCVMKLFFEVNQVNHKNHFVKEKTEKKKAVAQSRLLLKARRKRNKIRDVGENLW